MPRTECFSLCADAIDHGLVSFDGEPVLTIASVLDPASLLPAPSGRLSSDALSSSRSDIATSGDFLSTISQALRGVSEDQAAASGAENDVAAGNPNASMASALVLSDRAELAWNAVVAVRNEVVSAYQSVMNMTI